MKVLQLIFLLFIPALLHAQIITTIAGGGTSGLGDGGPATAASIGYFGGLAVDKYGNIYIADANHQKVRRVDAISGIITTIAGTGVAGYNGDSILAVNAQLNLPAAVSVDTFGNIYISDCFNYRVRKVDIQSGIISTFVGNGICDISGDNGPAKYASIRTTGYTTWDNHGNMYLGDSLCIRKINTTGIITTIAGNGLGGCSGDGGPATAAGFSSVILCTDHNGNIYLGADTCESVRKINVNTGIITRVAGNADHVAYPYSGDSTIATLCHLSSFGIAVDDTGNIYISDYTNNRIEKVDTFGIIHTIAGTGISGYSGDYGPAINAQISHPENVVLDKCGNVYIADFGNRRVRKITYRPCPDTTTAINNISTQSLINSYPNPTQLSLHIDNILTQTSYSLVDMIGVVVKVGILQKGNNELNIASLPTGIYFLKLTNKEHQIKVEKIIKQ